MLFLNRPFLESLPGTLGKLYHNRTKVTLNSNQILIRTEAEIAKRSFFTDFYKYLQTSCLVRAGWRQFDTGKPSEFPNQVLPFCRLKCGIFFLACGRFLRE